nr:zinc finger BED domain-containing protein RICESLEEPER 1-like [Aegilops tauschii subsp. strangulata]
MRFIYVPAPHTAEVIAEELHESLISWNLDEKLSTVTVDNCSSNDKTIDLLVKRIGKDKLMLQDADNEDGQSFWSCLQDIQEGIQDLAL